MNKRFTFIDLFAGIGGFRLALQGLGGECIGFSEIAPDAIHCYCANFNESELHNLGDITKITQLPQCDILTAGVPCQSWSIAGKNLGFDDDRGQLWNDALFLLNQTKPKAFIFENVKGLTDPRNKEALDYIMSRIAAAGYYAKKFVLDASDYGSVQTRVRIYIVGFRNENYIHRLELPMPTRGKTRLVDVLDCVEDEKEKNYAKIIHMKSQQSLSCNEQGFNDYFLFNDLRGGDTTIHSWDIKDTTDRQKMICNLLLRNRRKPYYGPLDGNPLSLRHFQELDETISQKEIDDLVNLEILKKVSYLYEIKVDNFDMTEPEAYLLSLADGNTLNYDIIKNNRGVKKQKIDVLSIFNHLECNGVIRCIEHRYDFKNSKISTGINGVNRIFLPSSKIYPTLVASDTNDYISTVGIEAKTKEEYKGKFLDDVFLPGNYRKITKEETCRIQGFPDNFILPEARPRWMKLLGNSVCVPIVKMIAEAIVATGVFGENTYGESMETSQTKRYEQYWERGYKLVASA